MTRGGDIEALIAAAAEQGFIVKDLGTKWMVQGKDGLSQQLIHKPHKKSGSPAKVRSQLRRLGVTL